MSWTKSGIMAAMLALSAFAATPQQARASGHSYINMMRSGAQNNVFVSQGFEVDYGKYERKGLQSESAGEQQNLSEGLTSNWKGYGFKTSLGLEMMKFIAVDVGHTFVTMRDGYNRLESLSGSRLHAGLKLIFTSPVGNLEAGGGMTGARLDYQNALESADYYGSGVFYSLGINYFLSTQVSLHFYGKVAKENLVRNGGSAIYRNIRSDTTGLGFGFDFWI